jgi:hypothetical protein
MGLKDEYLSTLSFLQQVNASLTDDLTGGHATQGVVSD